MFDRSWRLLRTSYGYPIGKSILPPSRLEDILNIAERLAADLPLVRADFYYLKVLLYFGEFTFYPASGLGRFEPREFDFPLGQHLDLTPWLRHESARSGKGAQAPDALSGPRR